MLPIIFIILGIVLIILCGISLIMQPKQVIIVHNIEDLKKDSNREKNTGKGKLSDKIICLTIAVIFLIIGLVILYASRGNDSFLSVNLKGINTGNDDIQSQQEPENRAASNIINSTEYEYSVVVSEKTILFNNQQIDDTNQFEAYLKTIDRQHTIILVDDFAVSATFHKVQELLDAYGMKYQMESDG